MTDWNTTSVYPHCRRYMVKRLLRINTKRMIEVKEGPGLSKEDMIKFDLILRNLTELSPYRVLPEAENQPPYILHLVR